MGWSRHSTIRSHNIVSGKWAEYTGGGDLTPRDAVFRTARSATYTGLVNGTLYVVGTPIGNLEDLSLRAARVLGEVDLIAAEDTGSAAKLLRHLGLRIPTVAYNDRNKRRSTWRILAALREGQSVAVISEAGTPGVSDPGQDLVAAALEQDSQVVPIPGASAVTALLSVAGLRTRTVRILGFLPRRSGERRQLFETVRQSGDPAVLFESPHRIRESLAECAAILPEAQLVIGRELTKLHEEIWRGTAAAAAAYFRDPRGEFTIIIAPAVAATDRWAEVDVRTALAKERALGHKRADAAASVALIAGWARRSVYALWPEVKTARLDAWEPSDPGQ